MLRISRSALLSIWWCGWYVVLSYYAYAKQRWPWRGLTSTPSSRIHLSARQRYVILSTMAYYQNREFREPENHSRATSINSSRSRRSSTMSRAQTLIRKNIDSHDLRPSDIIIERFVAWKAIVKQLVCASHLAFQMHNAIRGVCLTPSSNSLL